MAIGTGYSDYGYGPVIPSEWAANALLNYRPPYDLHTRGTPNAPIDLTDVGAPPPKKRAPRKRKAAAEGEGEDGSAQEAIKMTRKRKSAAPSDNNDGGDEGAPPKKKKKTAKSDEKRLRTHRKKAPQAYADIRHRALTQRMFVIDRQRTPAPADVDPQSPENHPTEVISLAGTTGNIYQITIDRAPSCNCPHAKKGNQCKHIVYVLARVLRAREDLEYQLAFISSELREIFEKAPPLPSEVAEKDQEGEMDGNRKPLKGEDCPICMMEFETDMAGKAKAGEEVVYCKAACGNNIHKECFGQWAATKKASGHVTCPFCRSPWQEDEATAADLKGVAKGGKVNSEGYVNVAHQLGLSGERDYSTYNEFWVRRQFGDY